MLPWDRDRLVVLKNAQKCGKRPGISERQIRRLMTKLKKQGDKAVIHGLSAPAYFDAYGQANSPMPLSGLSRITPSGPTEGRKEHDVPQETCETLLRLDPAAAPSHSNGQFRVRKALKPGKNETQLR